MVHVEGIARLIRTTRRELGLTQAELARLARTTQPAIARIESGRTSPNLGKVELLMAVMGKALTFGARPLEALDSGVDSSLIYANLRRSPAQRLKHAEGAARGIEALRSQARQVA